MTWAITFQQTHKLCSSSTPTTAFNLLWYKTFPRCYCCTATNAHEASQASTQQISSSVCPPAKSELSIFLQGRPRSVPKPGPEAEPSNFCSCPSQGQADPPATDHAANGSSGCQRAGKWRRNTTVSARRHGLMGTATSCLPQELLDSKEPVSGKLFRFPLQALAPALCSNSETSFSSLGLTSEPRRSPLLAKYTGFCSSSWSHMFAAANWRFNEEGNATDGVVIPSCWSQILLFSAELLHAWHLLLAQPPGAGEWSQHCSFTPGQTSKPTVEHAFQMCYKIQPAI